MAVAHPISPDPDRDRSSLVALAGAAPAPVRSDRMKRLLIATTNPGKLREFRNLLSGSGWEVISPDHLNLRLDVAETGATYVQNATIKAVAYAEASGLVALADDSGLEVDALSGEPGIYSARYGGPGLSDRDRVELLLEKLRDVPDANRTARFRAAVVIATPDGRQFTGEGTVEGRILHESRGSNGFGYDPVFLLPERGVTTAELEPAVKDSLSHRARALDQVRGVLDELRAGP
jgi:XTP/dITP diphosphohydrolase